MTGLMSTDEGGTHAEVERVSSTEFTIEVPASIANLGPGFDTLAVAVQLYLRLWVRIEPGTNGLRFHFRNFELEGENSIERAFLFLARQRESSFPSLSIDVESEIPMRAGLGSSAAATVAGLRLYETVLGGLTREDLLNAATALECHADNVAAALLGGLTASCQLADNSVFAVRLQWPQSLHFLVLTPQLSLSTSASRSILPETISHEDATFNLQRMAILIQALQSGNVSFLREALQDRLHQPFRRKLVPGLEELMALKHPDLLGVCLSGSGPSIVAFAEQNFSELEDLLHKAFLPIGVPFTIRRLSVHQPSNAWSEATLHVTR